MSKIDTAYSYVLKACNDPRVGYSQTKRQTIKLGANSRTYCDCSSIISWALTKAGIFKSNPWFVTANENSALIKAGFKRYNAKTTKWRKGDILWRSGHTEMVYSAGGGCNGRTMGAHTSKTTFNNQVCVNSNMSTASNWTYLYRWPETSTTHTTTGKTYSGGFPKLPSRGYYTIGDGYKQLTSYKAEIKKIQKFLVWAGYSVGSAGADGKYGSNTAAAVRSFQKVTSLAIDGKYGKNTRETAMRYKK